MRVVDDGLAVSALVCSPDDGAGLPLGFRLLAGVVEAGDEEQLELRDDDEALDDAHVLELLLYCCCEAVAAAELTEISSSMDLEGKAETETWLLNELISFFFCFQIIDNERLVSYKIM